MSLGRWSALLGVVGFVVGALGSWRPSFWYDEAATVFSATRRMPDLLRLLQHQDAVHGLYYLGMHFWLRVFGAGELAARLPSAIAVGVATAGVVLLGGRLASVRVGIASGVLFLVLPRVTWAAAEARDLGLTAALAVWLTVLLLAAVRHNDIRWWLGYVLLAVVSVAMFLPSALLVVAHAVTLGWRRESRSVLVPFGIAAIGVAGLSAPVVWFLQRQSGQVAWIPPLDARTVRAVWEYQWFVGAPVFAVLFMVLLLAGAVAGRRGPVVSLALPWAVLPTLALLAYSVLVAPYYLDRYLTFTTPAIALLGGASAVALGRVTHGRFENWVPFVVVGALVIAAVPGYLAQRGPWSKPSEMDFADVASFVSSNAAPGDCVAFAEHVSWNPSSARVALEAYPDAFAGLRDVSLGQSAIPVGWLWDETLPPDRIADRLATCDVLWFVTDADRDDPRTIRHTSGELWQLPAYHFLASPDHAAVRSQGFTVTDTYPLHVSQVWRLRHS